MMRKGSRTDNLSDTMKRKNEDKRKHNRLAEREKGERENEETRKNNILTKRQ